MKSFRRQSRHCDVFLSVVGRRSVISAPKYPSAQFVFSVMLIPLRKAPLPEMRPGFVKPSAPRVTVEVTFPQVSSRYVDSRLNVLFPSGSLELAIPKRDV